MARYKCLNCGHIYDEKRENDDFTSLENDWKCPTCFSEKGDFRESEETPEGAAGISPQSTHPSEGKFWEHVSDELEAHIGDIHEMAKTGKTVIEAMGTRKRVFSWDEILIKGAQLAKMPLNEEEPVNTRTVIGPRA